MEVIPILRNIKRGAKLLKSNLIVLYLSFKDPRVPWYGKLIALCVVAYAFSPVDLIPDFIPILGYLDDLVIVPLGILLALRLIPDEVLAENRLKAQQIHTKFKNWITGGLFIIIWICAAIWITITIYDYIVR